MVDIKREEELKRDRHWDAGERWRLIQETITWAKEIASQLEQAGETLRYTYGRCAGLGDKETLTRGEDSGCLPGCVGLYAGFIGCGDEDRGVYCANCRHGILKAREGEHRV
jgi:hypothetical protein